MKTSLALAEKRNETTAPPQTSSRSVAHSSPLHHVSHSVRERERERESKKNRKAPRVTRENFYPKKSISSIKRTIVLKRHTRACTKEEDEEDEESRTVFEDDDEEDVIVAHLETDAVLLCIIIAFRFYVCLFPTR